MEDNLIYIIVFNRKMTSIYLRMEDNLKEITAQHITYFQAT
jgi:hypothetical protein